MHHTRFTLLRHGQCQNDGHIRGSTDSHLTSLGWRQMQTSIDARIATQGSPLWTQIITSPLARCRQFSEDTGKKLKLPVYVEKDLRERHFGCWEDVSIDSLLHNDADRIQNFWQHPERTEIPDAEPFAAFLERTQQVWSRIQSSCRGERVLVVTHGGTIRSILAACLQIPDAALSKISVAHASVSDIDIYEEPPHPNWVQLSFHGVPAKVSER